MSARTLTLLFVLDLASCIALSYVGFWYLVFIPSAIIGVFLKVRWMNLVYFGVSGALGTVVTLLLSQTAYRLETSSIVASVIGIPGGFVIPLVLTLLISFLISGLGSMITSSFRG
jgi:uncharacterized membrane protein YjjB (DUF3815 family)